MATDATQEAADALLAQVKRVLDEAVAEGMEFTANIVGKTEPGSPELDDQGQLWGTARLTGEYDINITVWEPKP